VIHAELLAEIDSLNDSCSVVEQLTTTLREVVELHKPITHLGYEDEGFFCANCEFDYPCPTIQAIERKLK
jgi:hypothetical protein